MTEHTHTHDIDGYLSRSENISLSIVGGNEVLIALIGIAVLMVVCFLANRKYPCHKPDANYEELQVLRKMESISLGERSRRFTEYS
jgi:hypothetical protein